MRAMGKLRLPQLRVPGMEGHPELAAITLPRDKLWVQVYSRLVVVRG